MALYNAQTYSTTGTKASVNLDASIAPFQVSVVCTLTAGTVSYKVQYSLDPETIADSDATWNDSTGIPASTTASAATTFVGPVSRVRVVIGSLSGGSLVVQVRQGFTVN